MPVMVREDAWPRMRALAAKMGWDERTAIGCIVSLWTESQALGLHEGSREEILFWCKEPTYAGRNADASDKLISVLQDRAVRFISPASNGAFKIHGNREEIKRIEERREQHRNAANVRWKRKKSGMRAQCERMEKNDASAMPKQDKTKQDKTRQDKTEPSSLYAGHSDEPNAPASLFPEAPSLSPLKPRRKPKADPAPTTAAGQVWLAYRDAYQSAYGQEPVRNAKVNAQCSQLVARLGAEGALAVVRFYLSHQGRFYVQTCHALGPCLKDAEALHTQMLAGHRVTSTEAQQADKGQSNRTVFEKVAADLEAKYGGTLK